jgi:hypothetical protein
VPPTFGSPEISDLSVATPAQVSEKLDNLIDGEQSALIDRRSILATMVEIA